MKAHGGTGSIIISKSLGQRRLSEGKIFGLSIMLAENRACAKAYKWKYICHVQ